MSYVGKKLKYKCPVSGCGMHDEDNPVEDIGTVLRERPAINPTEFLVLWDNFSNPTWELFKEFELTGMSWADEE